jgi:hypothetical protein
MVLGLLRGLFVKHVCPTANSKSSALVLEIAHTCLRSDGLFGARMHSDYPDWTSRQLPQRY